MEQQERETHRCPAPGCTKEMPWWTLACAFHWRQLPAGLKARINRLWKARPLTREYFAARQEAVDWWEAHDA